MSCLDCINHLYCRSLSMSHPCTTNMGSDFIDFSDLIYLFYGMKWPRMTTLFLKDIYRLNETTFDRFTKMSLKNDKTYRTLNKSWLEIRT